MKFFIMDPSGHETLDITNTNDAMTKFAELVGDKKYTAATRKTGETDYRVIKNIRDIEDETLFVPAMKGG